MSGPATLVSSPLAGVGRRIALLSLLGGVALGGGCTDGGTAPLRPSSVSLSVSGPATGPEGLTVSDGRHRLDLTAVALVVGEVRLRHGAAGVALQSGPFVMEVPLDGQVRSLVAGAVPAGLYGAMELALGPPRPADPVGADLLEAHPAFAGVSVRVDGRWDGVPFVWAASFDELRIVPLDPPVEVDGRTANLTLRLDVASWFRAPDGTLVDPASAVWGAPGWSVVETRIRESFAVFEDADVDGSAGED